MPDNLIEWRDEFRIGLSEVDHEHRMLIEAINRVHRDLASGAAVPRVTAALGDIHAAIASHFALEEKEMAALRYDGLQVHKAEHERLLDSILDMLDDVHAAGGYEPDVLGPQLSAWFVEHFRTLDAQLHRWLARHPGAAGQLLS
ncbi:MAG: hemerythrin domain-containing protein [Steroidobacteraceae bacterium]